MTTPWHVLGGARAAVHTLRRAAMVHAQEAAMLMSGAATAPRRLISGDGKSASVVTPSAKAHGNSTTRSVLLVHGFGGAKSHWSLVAQALTAQGLTVEAITYAPLGNSVERLAHQLVTEVENTLAHSSADKVHLVGHSLGGVIIAQAITDPRLHGRVDTVVTLGSPFGGSPWATMLPFFESVRALRQGSPLLRRLATTPLPDGVRWLSVTAALDIIVPGLRSVPFHAQAQTITINGVGHLGMLLSGQVIGCIAAALCTQQTPAATEPATRRLPKAS